MNVVVVENVSVSVLGSTLVVVMRIVEVVVVVAGANVVMVKGVNVFTTTAIEVIVRYWVVVGRRAGFDVPNSVMQVSDTPNAEDNKLTRQVFEAG